jgi:hypothetical protein
MKNVPRWVKIPVTIGIILGLLFLIWLAIRTIFPLPVKNAIEITENGYVIDVVDIPEKANGYPHLDRLENGNWVYYVYTNPRYSNEETIDRLYILSDEFAVIDTFDFDYDAYGVYALDNGNFNIIKTVENDDGSKSDYLVEYNPELEIVSEKPFPYMMEFYNDGYYYVRGGGLKILDENLTLVNEYKYEDFPGIIHLGFIKSYDGEVFLCVSDNGYGIYNLPTSYLLRPINGGEDVKYSLASDMAGDFLGNRPGDERYDFYTLSNNLNETLYSVFLKNVGGDYLYGINKDGSFEKIGNYVSPYADSTFNYYQGMPFDGKRYYADTERDDETGTMTLYLYEYTGTYPN